MVSHCCLITKYVHLIWIVEFEYFQIWMSGSHREVRDIVKTVVCSKVHFINSCSIYRLAVLPFTEETIDDISLATGLIVSLLFLSLFPSPTPPLLHLPFLLALFFPVFASHFFVLGCCLCSFSSSHPCASFNYKCCRRDLPTFSFFTCLFSLFFFLLSFWYSLLSSSTSCCFCTPGEASLDLVKIKTSSSFIPQ